MPDLRTNSNLVPSARMEGTALIATLRGEIDLQNSPDVRVALLQLLVNHRPVKLILNLSQVPYMDSSAIAVLVETLQKMRKAGGKMYLTSLQPRVQSLLEIARLNSFFILAKDEAEALAK